MRFSHLEIKEIWAPAQGGFVRGLVELEFSDDALGGDMPVMPAVRIHPFIKHDGAATLEALEVGLLAEAQRLLKLALQSIDGKSPSAIRQAVEISNQEEAARQQEITDAAVAAELQNLQST